MMRLRFVVALLIGFLMLVGTPQPGFAQDVLPQLEIAEPSPNDLRELMRLLSDERVQNWLSKSAEAEGVTASDPKNVSFRDQLVVGLAEVRVRMAALGQAWILLPETPEMLADRWQSEMKLHRKIRSLTFLVIFLFVGAGLEWLYRQYTTIPLMRLAMLSHSAPTKRLMAAGARAAITAVGLLLFAFGSVGAFLSFDWPPLIETVILNLLMVIIVVRVIRALTRFVLAPRVPDLRLVPVSNKIAKYLHIVIPFAVGIIVVAIAITDIFARLTMDADGNISPAALSVSVAAAAVVSLLLFAVTYRAFRLWHRVHGHDGGMNWKLYFYVLISLTFLLWLIGTGPLMWSVLLIGSLFPILRLLRGWVDHFFDQARDALWAAEAKEAEELALLAVEYELAQDEAIEEPVVVPEEAEEMSEPYSTWRLLSQRLVRFFVVIVTVLMLVDVWGTGIFALSESTSIAGRMISVIIDATFVILVADLVWTWAKTTIDKRLAAYKPPEDGAAPGPEARMATLLPLLRVTLLVSLAIMVIFSMLSSLGVNIAPLIAGAGVLGIAIGFGAQSLVRDVVSGVFFLIDDAFRIGEYIEIGELRGTVEGISIRSLRVRHHRGMMHTIPFGELKSLTNHSRDWVIMKLEFRVPFDTDLQLVKKLVKKVGAELLANEFYGKSILSTLKSQGVRRMEEFNMVVGVKFMTKPGEQWLVRRDAYQKVRDIFEANGIRMAERNVVVEIQGGEGLSEAERKAAAGAAQAAAEGPQLPPGPAPDEP